jgi:hypothetical protein
MNDEILIWVHSLVLREALEGTPSVVGGERVTGGASRYSTPYSSCVLYLNFFELYCMECGNYHGFIRKISNAKDGFHF